MNTEKSESGNHSNEAMFGFASKNPLLKNITDYLIEEASAEEEELLGTTEIGEIGEDDGTGVFERDENLIKVLDRLLIYLRVVHSLDYYNHSDYPNEDEMPNRIGIMHARGMISTSSRITQQEVNEYIKNFENKVQPFLEKPLILIEDELVKLGKKEESVEVEKFINENTQELGKDKWLCPLSGKKFKGPDFVRKHIFNKHAEKVEERKKEVEYFNNYLADSKRPQLPEHPSNRPQQLPNRDASHNSGMGGGPGFMGPGPNYGGPPPYMNMFGPPRGPPLGGYGGPGYGPNRFGPMGPPDYARGPGSGGGKPRFGR